MRVCLCALCSYSADPGWGVRCGCFCLDSGFGCAPPLLAGVLGCVFVDVHRLPVPRHSWPGVCGVWVGCYRAPAAVPWFVAGCVPCPGLRYPWPSLLGICVCAVDMAGGVPLWRASWSRVGALRLVRSCRSRCSGRLSRRCGAFPHPGGLRPGFTGQHRGPCGEPISMCRLLAAAEAAALAFLCVGHVWGPKMELSLAGPTGAGLGLRALRWFACVDPVTDASGFPYRLSPDRRLGQCTGAVYCGRRHRSFWVGGRHARVLCVFAC